MTATSTTDGDLVRQAQRGDKEAFTELVRRFQDLAHGLAYHRLGDFEDARDAAQSAFVRAYQELPGLRDADAFRAWLRRIVENECLGTLRRRRPTAPLHEALAAKEDDPHARIDLQRALDRLAEKDRLVLTLFVFQDRSLQDVAGFLGVSKDAIMSRLRHVRARLRTETLHMAESTLKANRLPEDWATKIPIPCDEYDGRGLPKDRPETLSPWRRDWLLGAFSPGTEIVSVESRSHESQRVELRLPTGESRTVDLRMVGRKGGNETEAALLPVLARAGIPVPALVLGPSRDPDLPDWSTLLAVESIEGETACRWALAGDPKSVAHACEVVLDAAERLAAATAAVEAAGIAVERSSLKDELDRIVADGGPWMEVPTFREATKRLRPVVEAIDVPPVLSDSGIGGINVLLDDAGRFAGLVGVAWARIEDPHYGITKFWTYDCWPLRWAGIVERHLVRHGLTMKDLAPRLAVRALATLQREIPVEGGDAGYRNDMFGWLKRGTDSL